LIPFLHSSVRTTRGCLLFKKKYLRGTTRDVASFLFSCGTEKVFCCRGGCVEVPDVYNTKCWDVGKNLSQLRCIIMRKLTTRELPRNVEKCETKMSPRVQIKETTLIFSVLH
jgi:hypothetical protein